MIPVLDVRVAARCWHFCRALVLLFVRLVSDELGG